jgi:predicted PurR-regulated permease PerM
VPAIVPPSHWQRVFFVVGSFILIVAALYWAQKILILLALAVLIAFVLQPLAAALQRGGLRRAPAAILSVALALAVVSGLAWLFSIQIRGLGSEWTTYKVQIHEKIDQLDPVGDGYLLDRLQTMSEEVVNRILAAVITPLVETVFGIIFIIILVLFILLRREDLRNRLIRLIGHGRHTIITTKALDEAARRISRYLLMQMLLNGSFGLVLGAGLSVIGLPYPLLWGFLAAVMRFVPYIGTWVILALPLLLSLATSSAWAQPVEVLALFLSLEILTANVFEPLLFGMSAGISPLALLVAAMFWGWLWGPIGLILSTPLTVCLYVMGRYVPQLEIFEILLGDEPPLDPSVTYYQRLVAHDQDEAADVIEQELQSRPLEQIFDNVLVPALVLAKRDRERGELDDDGARFALQATHQLIDELGYFESLVAKPVADSGAAVATTPSRRPPATILGCPAADDIDELALVMFQQLLEPAGVQVEVASAKMLVSEVMDRIESEGLSLVFIVAVFPGGLTQARYLCKRLRGRFAELKIVVGRWGPVENFEVTRERLIKAGADLVSGTLLDSRGQIVPLARSLAHLTEAAPPQDSLPATNATPKKSLTV